MISSFGLKPVFKSSPDNRARSNDLYFFLEQDFLKEGETFSQLNNKRKTEIQDKYRFSPLFPGSYQNIGKKVSGGARGKSSYKRF